MGRPMAPVMPIRYPFLSGAPGTYCPSTSTMLTSVLSQLGLLDKGDDEDMPPLDSDSSPEHVVTCDDISQVTVTSQWAITSLSMSPWAAPSMSTSQQAYTLPVGQGAGGDRRVVLMDSPLSLSKTLVSAGVGQGQILVEKCQQAKGIGRGLLKTRPKLEVSVGCKNLVDISVGTDPKEPPPSNAWPRGFSEPPLPVRMNLPPQGPPDTYAQSVMCPPIPQPMGSTQEGSFIRKIARGMSTRPPQR